MNLVLCAVEFGVRSARFCRCELTSMKTFAFVFLIFRQLFEQNIIGISAYLPSGYELCPNSIRRPYPKRLLLLIVSSLFFESVFVTYWICFGVWCLRLVEPPHAELSPTCSGANMFWDCWHASLLYRFHSPCWVGAWGLITPSSFAFSVEARQRF